MADKQVDEVVKEFAPVGKYRVRVLNGKGARCLDVREYVSSDTWEGYTRRGIRLNEKAKVELLKDILTEALDLME